MQGNTDRIAPHQEYRHCKHDMNSHDSHKDMKNTKNHLLSQEDNSQFRCIHFQWVYNTPHAPSPLLDYMLQHLLFPNELFGIQPFPREQKTGASHDP